LATGFVILSAVVANAAKYIIPRHRPHTLDDLWPSSTWETFGSPFTKSWFDESVRSFPSGHTATAVAMAIGLSYVYPRGRAVFFFMAILASLQRLFSGAHFASDILTGLTITLALGIAWLWLASRKPARQPHQDPVGEG
jgi:membrane-associated phospholipid phosphatase